MWGCGLGWCGVVVLICARYFVCLDRWVELLVCGLLGLLRLDAVSGLGAGGL